MTHFQFSRYTIKANGIKKCNKERIWCFDFFSYSADFCFTLDSDNVLTLLKFALINIWVLRGSCSHGSSGWTVLPMFYWPHMKQLELLYLSSKLCFYNLSLSLSIPHSLSFSHTHTLVSSHHNQNPSNLSIGDSMRGNELVGGRPFLSALLVSFCVQVHVKLNFVSPGLSLCSLPPPVPLTCA